MNCIDLMSKLAKMLSYVAKHSKQRKTTKVIKLQWIASIWHQNDLKCWVTSQNYKCDHITMNLHRFDVKTITTTQNYESDQIIMHCINLTSKRSKKLSYVPKLQKKSNYNELHGFDVKNIKPTQNYKSDLISMNFNRFDVKTIKTFELGRKTTKVIKLQWIASIWRRNDQNFWVTSLNYKVIELQLIASIWCQNDQECWVTSQNIQNNAKLRKSSNYNELHRFDVKTITTTQNYQSDQIIMHCIDLTSKRSKLLSYVAKLQSNRITINCIDLMPKRSRMLSYVAKHSKQRKTTKVIKLQWIASIWRQNDHNNAKLRKWSNYNALHRFDVKTSKNVEVRRKTFKTTQNYKWNQITMNLIDLTSERSKMLSYVAKLRKSSNYNELHRFDIRTI